VSVEHAEGIDDVQRLFILLWPGAESIKNDEKEMKRVEGSMGEKEPERLIIIAKKKLPEVGAYQHGKYWGFVDRVSYRIEDLDKELDAKDYTTKTRGERHVEGARPVGEGVYALVRYHDHVHLAYVLEMPEEPTKIQEAFNIGKEGSYVIQVKNPDIKVSFNFLGDKHVKYPADLMHHFIGKTGKSLKFTPAFPALLDYEGAEMLFIGVSDDVKVELGEAGEYLEELQHIDARKITDEKLWKELHLRKSDHPSAPLLKGKWK